MNQIKVIEKALDDRRKKLKEHHLYHFLEDMGDIRDFMESHVYAVWDFMSLLKSLQINLTTVTLPWKPANNPKTVRFINEIVLGEESDINELNQAKSHYEMYLDAMKEVGANTEKITSLVSSIENLSTIEDDINRSELSNAEKEFLLFTFSIINTNQSHKIASAFTFGREDLIPDMFIEIINHSNEGNQNQFPKLTYYLNRHIELDGDEHGPLSLEMIDELCGQDKSKWDEVLAVAEKALDVRIKLWDEILNKIKKKKQALEIA